MVRNRRCVDQNSQRIIAKERIFRQLFRQWIFCRDTTILEEVPGERARQIALALTT